MVRQVFLGLVLTWCLLSLPIPGTAGPAPSVLYWLPQDAIATIRLGQPKALLDLILDPQFTKAITSVPAYEQWSAQPGSREFLGMIAFLETTLGTDWKSGLRKLAGGGVTLAALPNDTVLFAVDAEDGRLLRQLHEILLGFARDEAAKDGEPDRVASQEYRGETVWTFGGQEAHAIVGNRFLLANRREAIKAALDLRDQSEGPSLARSPAYQAASKAREADNVASAFIHLAILKENPPFREALARNLNPLAALLFAPVMEALRGCEWIAITLDIENETKTISLQALVDGAATGAGGAASFAMPSGPNQGALPNLCVPRRIAGLSFYRDLYRFYGAKDDLFPERTSGLIFFENMMGIFFTGRDLTEEVFAETLPEVRFVVAEQEYDPAVGVPRVQIPSFAVVFRLRRPEKFGEVVEEAWQKAIGLINFTRGQQAQPGLIIDRPEYKGIKLTTAYFSSAQEEEKTGLETRYNFRPTLARLEQYLVLSSTDGLAKELIDALKEEASGAIRPVVGSHSLVEIDGIQLSSILTSNRENLIRQNMIEEGNTREQAEAELDLLTMIPKYLGASKLSVGRDDGRPAARLELKLNLPSQE